MFPRFLKYLIFFLSFFLILQLFSTPPENNGGQEADVVVKSSQTEYTEGEIVEIIVRNNTDKPIALSQGHCSTNPLQVFKYANGIWEEQTAKASKNHCLEANSVTPQSEQKVNYAPWNHDLFAEVGKYKIEYRYDDGNKERIYYAEFTVDSPSFITSTWRVFFYKPIYNGLIYLTTIVPSYSNLGFAIILLTVIIKLLLLGPNSRAIRAQQDMQKIQPKLKKIQTKYAGDQQKIAEETMKIWKEHKVNPFGSCLPLFIQLPIMLALFYVAQYGLDVENNLFLLYEFVANLNIDLDPMFLSVLDLTQNNYIVLPLIVGGFQYIQMSMIGNKMNEQKKDTKPGELDQAQIMNNTMKYVLPVMIAVFTASLPAAVGLYWGTSTLFAIGQQKYLMKK